MKGSFVRAIVFIAILVALFGAFTPGVFAQGNTPPALPSLDQLLRMSLGAVGALVFIALFGYYWGYWVSALAAKLPWDVPAVVLNLCVLVPTAAVAAGWNAFAGFINATYPGAMDKTVGDALLFIVNYLMELFFSRRGGLANVADVSRNGGLQIAEAGALIARARKGVLLLG